MIKRALISVSNKDGILAFAQRLDAKGVEILSTGGTAKLLRENNIDVVDVSDYTGHPEMMDGRVKTLHPKIHGGLLALRDNDSHMQAAEENEIGMIDLVAVNLYPFEETIKKEGVELAEAIENIDIGGPSMLRSAAKNYAHVTVVTDPADYDRVAEAVEADGNTSEELRRELAEKVFVSTAQYDSMIAEYLTGGKTRHLVVNKMSDLRYGENPHQKAGFYADFGAPAQACLPQAEILQGKELSYNNIMDADGALSMVREFEAPCVAFIKHSNPCGMATAEDLQVAFTNAYECDPKSAFGGIIAMNRTCTQAIAEEIVGKFFEIVLAPDFEEGALKAFEVKPKLRVLRMGDMKPDLPAETYRKVSGGLLIQDLDTKVIGAGDLEVATKVQPTDEQIQDMLFAWTTVKHVKSNAIVLAKDGKTVGIGAGQMSRVDAVEIAFKKSDGRHEGAVLASDAFFPFPDSIEVAAAQGIKAIIQPGGSIKDADVIAAADEAGIAMVFTGTRAFLH